LKFRYVLLVIVLLLLVSSASAWMTGYDYRKSHTITGSSAGDQTNYQVKIVVHRATGTDGGSDVYVGTKCKADYSDLRLTKTDDSLLDYWIESSDSSSATVWVEIPSIPTSGTQIYMYYGNTGASSVSNGDATFLFFDHFNGATLDPGKWTSTGGGAIADSTAIVKYQGTSASITSVNSVSSDNTAISMRANTSHSNSAGITEYLYPAYIDSSNYIYSGPSPAGTYVNKKTGTATSKTITGWSINDFHILTCIRHNMCDWYVDGGNNVQVTTNYPAQSAPVRFVATGTGAQLAVDWIFVRTFISPEPTQTTWGTEETNAVPPVAQFHANVTSGSSPLAVQFTDDSTGLPTSWNWSFNYGGLLCPFASSLQPNPVYVYDEPGVYNVSLNVTNSVGNNQMVKSSYITVTSPPDGYTITYLPFEINQSVVEKYGNKFKLESDLTLDPGLTTYGIFIHDITGVTLDGKNHILQGNSNTYNTPGIYPGIGISNASGCNIINSELVQWRGGIRFENVSSMNISNNNAHGNFFGIFGVFSHDILASNNQADGNTNFGITVTWVNNSQILNNHANLITTFDGIHADNCTGLLVANNVAGSNAGSGIATTQCHDITVRDNTASDNNQFGINFYRTNIGQILNNTVNANQEHGINTFESSDLNIEGNTADLNTAYEYSTGINISNSTGVTTVGNRVENNRNGITYYNVTGTRIENNQANVNQNHGIGIFEGTNGITIVRNYIQNNGAGFSINNNGPDILVYNNYLNNTDDAWFPVPDTTGITWNIDNTTGPDLNIIGGPYFGGNYWAHPDGSGWSQTHPDLTGNGFSPDVYAIQGDPTNTDNLPLAYPEVGPLPLQAQFIATPDSGTINLGFTTLFVQFTDQSVGEHDAWYWDFGDGTSSIDPNPSHTYTNVGLFSVQLTVTDTITMESSTAWMPVYVRPQVVDGVPIWIGWNFISIPSSLSAGNDTASIFNDVVNTAGKPMWSYNATTQQWRQVLGTDQLQTLEGYWIYSEQIGPFIQYHYDTSYARKTPRVKHLETGWNAIGLGSLYPGRSEQQLATLGDKWQIVLNFDSGLQFYYPPYVRGQTNEWGMEPTKGYWIYMNEPGDMVAVTG
jgi:parallel beta-helix repeat protein